MTGVDGNTVIFSRSALSDKGPVSVLFSKIESSGIGDKDLGDDPSGETKPADYPESGPGVDVVVKNSGDKGSEFTSGGRETVGGSSD